MPTNYQNLDFNKLLPSPLKNQTMTSLVSNLFNRFVSKENSVTVDGRIGVPSAQTSALPASDLDRELNALIPAVTFKTGAQESIFTFDDLINRLKVLDVDTDTMRGWAAEQWYNWTPPITLDKFVNYTNYYWVGHQKSADSFPSWNPTALPEYYVIARPPGTALRKMPVRLACLHNLNLYMNDRPPETFTLTFLSGTAFSVTSDQGPINASSTSVSTSAGSTVRVQLSAATALCSFTLTTGQTRFAAGDQFKLTIKYYTSDIKIAFTSTNPVGKGTLTGVTTDSPYMSIDGRQLRPNERVLVAGQTDSSQNGIYITTVGERWRRASDSDQPSYLEPGCQIYVKSGVSNAGHTFTLTQRGNGHDPFEFNDPAHGQLIFGVTSVSAPSGVSQWQEYNFWIHRDDFSADNSNFDLSTAVQATRPIIEYWSGLQLNSSVDSNGFPNEASVVPGPLVQTKTRFNQIPQFDLFRYDGTHAGSTSGIFFYEEDPDFSVDSALHRRVKKTANDDFVFGLGIKDAQGRLLYFKDNSQLRSVWRPGPATPTASSIKFVGASDRGSLVIDHITQPSQDLGIADNQTWTVTATSPASWSVSGSRSGELAPATTGVQYVCDDLKFTIHAGPTAFAAGEQFSFDIHAPLAPRYVKKLENGEVVNYPGWAAGDATDGVSDGTWLTPLRMFQNLQRETRTSIAYADFLSHARSVLRHQDGFSGVSYGNNNSHTLAINPGLGGTIRESSSNFPLLISMLMQKDVSPLTIIDFAEQQYNIALSSIDQFLSAELPALCSARAVTTTTLNPLATDIQYLLSQFEHERSQDENLKKVFGDTLSAVAAWPVTLPMIGLLAVTTPTVKFDEQLGLQVIVHHDGHESPLALRDADFDRALVRTLVDRSTGESTAGITSENTPNAPYAGQLWLRPSTFELKIFDVVSDSDLAPPGTAGSWWFKRSSGQLYEWDTVGNTWQLSTSPVSSRWVAFDSAAVRNSLVLAVEQRLAASVHPAQEITFDLSTTNNSNLAEIELARFSAKYGYDTYAPDFAPTDAFTWNYKSATIPSWTGPVPARWFDIYTQHFNRPGSSLPTSRPNIEPWKLLNYSSKPIWWDSMYRSAIALGSNVVSARVTPDTNVSMLSGLQTLDGVALATGDRVLLRRQSNYHLNGLYTVSAGAWQRTSDPLVSNVLSVQVTEGAAWAGTAWTLITSDPGTGQLLYYFEQVREWLATMWSDIQLNRPTLKLCVNVNTDELLPPYVSPSLFASAQALLTTIPPGTSAPYTFGDNGPVEMVWKRSLEYNYGAARSAFRQQPLQFLDSTWGDTYMKTADGLRLERNLMTPVPNTSFLLHGEQLHLVNQLDSQQVQARIQVMSGGTFTSTGAARIVFEVTHCADDRTVFYVYINDQLVGMFDEGESFSCPPTAGVTITSVRINDLGIPFEFGERLQVQFFDDIVVYPSASEQTCEGCVITQPPPVPTSVTPVAPQYSHQPALSRKYRGLAQLYTNLLRHSCIATDVSAAIGAYRGWDLKLCHRLGALIRQDTLTIDTALGTLPSTAWRTVLKRSLATQSLWYSALRIQVVEMGAKEMLSSGTWVPQGTASDWKFRIETYNPQHPVIERWALDPAGTYETFNALSGKSTALEWRHLQQRTQLEQITAPVTVIGLQAVIDFVFGYTDRLREQGWCGALGQEQPLIDQETGRNLDWQLEIEKFIDHVYSGISAGQGHILNPMINKIDVQTPIGLLSQFTENSFVDAYSMQAAYDVTGVVIPLSRLNIIRVDEGATVYSTTPIFSAHVFVDEFEHVIVLNEKVSSETAAATLFDPFLGISLNSADLSFVRQASLTRKPTFDGFFLSGNDVKRNIVSNIDNFGNFYNASTAFTEQRTAEHALSLLGFSKKQYFSGITSNDTTQFNFWKGLIHAKGTNLAIDSFANYKKFSSAAVDEYWAYKVAEFGDARERTAPEIKIQATDVTQKLARLQFYSAQDPNYSPLPLYTQIENSDDTRWFSIDDLGNGLRFDAEWISETVTIVGTTDPQFIKLKNIYHNGDELAATASGGASLVAADILRVPSAGTYTVSGWTWLNPSKLSPIKLFDYSQSTLVQEIGCWHPAIGIHTASALELVNITLDRDPAQYNYTTQTTDNQNFQHLKPWAQREVGRVWWDTRNLSYIPYYDAQVFPNRDARDSRWGTLSEWASIDLYEWTQSSVPPAEYDALSASQQGDSSIDASVRASGQAAFKTFYSRDRIVQMRPIAWSHVGQVSSGGTGHPSFGPARFTTVWASNGRLIADHGRTGEAALTSGRHFAAWAWTSADSQGHPVGTGRPIGEVIIGDVIVYDIGSSTAPGLAIMVSALPSITGVQVREISRGRLGERIGALTIKKIIGTTGTVSVRMSDSSGNFQDVIVHDWYSASLDSDNSLVLPFSDFGVQLHCQRAAIGTITASDLATAVTSPLNDLYVREAVSYQELIPLPATKFVNDPSDPDYVNQEYEWKTWEVPTQAELDADLASPLNAWLPVLGELTVVTATPDLVAQMNSTDSALELRSGIVIKRFENSWTEWRALLPTSQEKISDGTHALSFTLSQQIDANRLSLYVNGVQLNPAQYTISGDSIQLTMIQPAGWRVYMLYRAPVPSASALAFDPAISEDYSVQTQYKADYQYTVQTVRDSNGNISSQQYFFWVQNKTVPSKNKSMSLLTAQELLKSGPPAYVTWSRLTAANTAVPPTSQAAAAAFDSCAVAGLGPLVGKNDSFKLRFLRDFTLRDDPEELQLKNTHTEWTLLRKGQTTKIPKSLWSILTDAAAGQTAAGDAVPSRNRIEYDSRNGTRSRYGFKPGQIFAERELVVTSITNTILNTELSIQLGSRSVPDTITALDFSKSDEWFATAAAARETMTTIWLTARAKQINEIFFNVLEDALSNNYEFSDIFKTSLLTVSSSTPVAAPTQLEQSDSIY